MAIPQKVLALGGSKNIGYYAAVRLLDAGNTVTFLLRNPTCFDKDEVIQKHLSAGRVRTVKGDATVSADVTKAWTEAGRGEREGEVDVVLFTVGGSGTMTLKGPALTDPTVCTRAALATLSTLPPALRTPSQQPRFVFISSTGVTRDSHEALPLAFRVLYPWLLSGPHADKTALERVLAHVSGRAWTEPEPPAETMGGAEWMATPGLPQAGELKDSTVVVRPAFLTDGKAKGKYQLSREGMGSYTVSRQDVGQFIAEELLKGQWTKWRGDCVSIGY